MILGLVLAATLVASDPATAIREDPPVDAAHPASGRGVQFVSHGATINAQLYQPAGAGPHPTVILLHGLPGNEQNLDLARAIQRAGWTVITFHYRGSWGSGGRFTLKGGVEDADALLTYLYNRDQAAAWGVDPSRIVLIGHSYGGYVAAANARWPGVIGTALIAAWDISYDQRAWAKLSPGERAKTASGAFDDVAGRLGDVTVAALGADLMAHGADLDLTHAASGVAYHPSLVLTADRDDPDDQATGLLAALKTLGAPHLASARMPTDHGFNDHRVMLETAVLTWLDATLRLKSDTRERHRHPQGEFKDVEVIGIERATTASGIVEWFHTITVRTRAGFQLDLFATSGDPQTDVLPKVGEHCDARYRIRGTDFDDERPVIDIMTCAGRRIGWVEDAPKRPSR